MVGRKRLGYGSRGRRVQSVPRIPNSAQGKRSTRRKDDDMHAFDLLATVAGMLLADQDASSNIPNTYGAEESYAKKRKAVKQKNLDQIMPLKNAAIEKNGCSGFVVGSGSVNTFPRQANVYLADNSSTRIESESVLDLLTQKSNKACDHNCGLGIVTECRAFGVPHLGSTSSAEAEQVQEAEPAMMRSKADEHVTEIYSLFGSVDLDGRSALVSSDSSSGVPLCSHVKEPKTTLCQNEVQYTATIDDDDNFSGCTHPSTTEKKGYKPHYLSDHRIRKLFASKARKAARSKMCGGVSSKGRKLTFCGRKIFTTRQKAQRTIFKNKKISRHQFATSLAKGMLTEAGRTSFPMEDQTKSSEPEDYHVKLKIKSINIPELFIEVPENATVSSLKRTVMDVVNSIMEGSLSVGILLQGENIQDDSKTLRQAGICHGAKLNNIDFTLECEAQRDSPCGVIIPEDMDFSNADIVEPLARMKFEEPFRTTEFGDDNQQPMQSYPTCSFAGPGSVYCPVDLASQNASASSQAIIPVTAAGLNALAILPHCKSRRPEAGQRRMRRPFSVGEVEALVEAVELLGTGRWRDVKMHAFENADHRTYVDLKDKWKTLVHTASISPQQRRGTQVPQELLDRVLAAQAYWSQQQAKHEDKAALPEICLA